MPRKFETGGRRPPPGLFARLLDSLPNVFTLVLDEAQRIVYANASFLEHFGLEWPVISGQVCFALESSFKTTAGEEMGFCPPEPGPYFPAHYILTREVGGKEFVYEGTFYHLVGGEEEAWTVCSFRDVTQMFNLECQVRQLDELERMLVQASMDGIVVNDLLGRVIIFNEGASRILGYRPEEVIGLLKVDALYPEGLAHEIKELIYSPAYGGPGILENYETLVRPKDGPPVPVWLSARLLRENGREVGIVGYFRDLRERKRLEEELLRQERLATLGKMVAHVSHEIKNPLATIGGFAQQLARQEDVPAKGRQKLQLICQEVGRLEKFLADLGAYTRSAPTQKVPGDILALVREVIDFMEAGFQEQGVTFELSATEAIAAFPFDPGQMRQVLINLFKNSLEAMPRGGVLTVNAAVRGDHLVLTIADTGLGFAPEHLRSLFTPFFSTKKGGTGLGLTICRGLIDLHRGEIDIYSEVNRGATCIIRLPLSSA
ncbi:MAG: ATP-binding protein [Desulfobaccales bacterium]